MVRAYELEEIKPVPIAWPTDVYNKDIAEFQISIDWE